MSAYIRPLSYMGHEEVRHGRYWRAKPGILHRLSGPAIELADGDKEWWINGALRAWQTGRNRATFDVPFVLGTTAGRDVSVLPGYGLEEGP